MREVGFEPTNLSIYELESYPLDRSGIRAITWIFNYSELYLNCFIKSLLIN